jgi:hypothetical protein
LPDGKPPFLEKKSIKEILSDYRVPMVTTPSETELCKLENPLAPLWDYQNYNIEHRDPHLGAFSSFIMNVGDIYRTITENESHYWYLHEKIYQRLTYIHRMDEEFNIARLKEDVTPELLQRYQDFRKELDKWEEIVKNYPSCGYEAEKKMMLKSIDMDREYVDFVLGDMRGLNALKRKVDAYREEIVFLYPERQKKPTESLRNFEDDIRSSEKLREKWCEGKRGKWNNIKKVCELEEIEE